MFSAFSFGKIIKTILPGSILSGALLLILDATWHLTTGKSAVVELVHKEWVTVIAAALVPISLILGFLLNTLVWLSLNKQLRKEAEAGLEGTAYPKLRQRLSNALWADLSPYLGTDSAGSGRPEGHPRESLEYFYLPVMSFTNLNYLRESYFSWYEFQINTALATAAFIPCSLVRLGTRMWATSPCLFVAIAIVLLLFTIFLFRTLRGAAIKNLTEYEKNLLLLIVGSVTAATRYPSATRPESAEPSDPQPGG